MKLEGHTTIAAPQDKVWEFLTDPNQVSQCVPGLQSMEIVAPQEQFKAIAAIGFGTVQVTFTTDVTWTRLESPSWAEMKAHGTAPGSAADVLAEMRLSPAEDGATDLYWTADVTVVGTIASLAARMLGSVAKVLTGAFFNCVQKHIES
jgi:carbon monoxide dehydrogenase subunit G